MAKLNAGSTIGGKEIADKEYVNSQVTTSFDALNTTVTSHLADTTKHITSAERTKWNSAEPNQNAFSNVKVGATTVAADNTTDTLELVAGSGITLTPDATNDKITITANEASTSTAGIVQLNNTVTSTSTTQAATANATKQAYDRAVSAEANAKAYTDQQLSAHLVVSGRKEYILYNGILRNGSATLNLPSGFTSLNDFDEIIVTGELNSANESFGLTEFTETINVKSFIDRWTFSKTAHVVLLGNAAPIIYWIKGYIQNSNKTVAVLYNRKLSGSYNGEDTNLNYVKTVIGVKYY